MLPEEIRELREQLELSMSQLAQELKLDVTLLIDWEAGRRFPTKRAVNALEKLKASQGQVTQPRSNTSPKN